MPSEFSESHVFHEKNDGEQYHSSDAAHIFGPEDVDAALANTEKITGDKTAVAPEGAVEEPIPHESPSSLFSRAYEAVRNTDTVSNIVDKMQILWKGSYIDVIERDIQRLEALKTAQDAEAGRHKGRLETSAEHSSTLNAIAERQKLSDLPVSHTDAREVERQAIQSRAEAHAVASEKIAAELIRKQELKAQYEKDREAARSRIAERFQRKIEKNEAHIQRIDGAVQEIDQQIEIGNKFLEGLRADKSRVDAVAGAADALSSDKKAARLLSQELEGQIQDLMSKLKLHADAKEKHTTKQSALMLQKNKWESKIAPKKDPEVTMAESHPTQEDQERLQGFIEETLPETNEEDVDDAIDVTHLVEDEPEEKAVEKDPWVGLLENIQSMMKDPEYQKYDDEAFRKVIEQQGTPEQKLLLQNRIFLNELYKWLDSASDVEKTRKEKTQLLAGASDSFADLLDGEDAKFVEQFRSDEGRAMIESQGTPDQKFIVKLLDYLSNFLEDVWHSNEKNKKPLL